MRMSSQRKFISRFSPGRTDPKVLEAITVAREDLLARAVAVLRESAITENKHHLLFVGPRGSGKTHLLALIFHRLRDQPDLAQPLRIAWLNEDETSTSFLDLLLRIYRALSDRYPPEFPAQDLERLAGRERVEAQDLLGQSLLSRIGQRTVLVMIENLDTLFAQLDESEQCAWRAFVQDHPVFATLATAQSLFAGVSQREQPFFGFFDTTHLQPLTPAEAVELLQRIAQVNQDASLADFLGTARGKARVQAIDHLSGGNPRLYIVLSEFVTSESLDTLVGPLEGMVDEQLTPYYQERLRWLSPQQRKIVEFLCSRGRPVPVKEIAAALFAEPGSIGSQLQKLREMGYVRPNPRGRESLYELAEPLMRLSMEVKNTRDRQPLRLIVDFLRIWFDRDELERLSADYDPVSLGFKYLLAALQGPQPGQPDLRRDLLLHDLRDIDIRHCNQQDLERMRLLAEASSEPGDWIRYGVACHHHEEFLTAVQWFSKVVELPGATPPQIAWALVNRGACLGRLGRTEEAITDSTRVLELTDAPSEQVAMALVNRGIGLGVLGRTDEATSDYTRVIDMRGAAATQVALALVNRGLIFGRRGQAREAAADLTRVVELPDAPTELVAQALTNRGFAFNQLGRAQDALADYARAIELPGAPVEQVATAFFNRGLTLGQMGRTQEAIADFTRIIDLPNASAELVAKALVDRGVALSQIGRIEDASAEYDRAIEVQGAQPKLVARALFLRALASGTMGRTQAAIADLTRAIELPNVPPEEAARALVARAAKLGQVGRSEEAKADLVRAVGLPGSPAEEVSVARGMLFSVLVSGGWTSALEHLVRFLASPHKPPPVIAQVSEALVQAIFSQFGSPAVWPARAAQSVALYREHGALAYLGGALVQHLARVKESALNNSGLDQWFAGWATLASGDKVMEFPLRLFRTGIAFLKAQPRDEGVLLQLPAEERRLVRMALGLAEERSE